jgi:hypothetical protein
VGASVSFGHATNYSIPCNLRPRKGFRACARGWGEDRDRREVAEYQYCARIGQRCLQACEASVRDFAAVSRWFREAAKGEKGGGSRLFIAEVGLEEKLGFGRGRSTAGEKSCGRGELPEERDDTWARCVSGRRGYRFGTKRCWAVGWISGWSELFPHGLLYIFLF